MQLEPFSKNFFENLTTFVDNSLSFLIQIAGEMGEKTLLNLLQLINMISLKTLEHDTVNAAEVQKNLLNEILTIQKNTIYGKKYNFSEIQTIDEFRRAFPLSTYENYRSLIENLVETNDYTQFVAEPITLFQETAGTTGKTKLIPRTNRLSLSFMKSFQATESVAKSYFTKEKEEIKCCGLALLNVLPVHFTPHGVPRGTGTSGAFNESFKKIKLVQNIIRLKFSSPPSVFFLADYETAYYCHLLFALIEENLTYISANFASNVLEALQILERNWEPLIQDIQLGRINKKLNLKPDIRNELENILVPNPERAKKLKIEFEKGMEGILPRVWHQLSCIQCVTSGSMRLYHEKLKYYAKDVPFYSAAYGASEAWIGVNLEPQNDSPTYVITPHSAFFEFIKIADIDLDKPSTFDLTSLQVGESYEVVITTVAGLYRYRLGDIVKCVGYYNQSPIVSFLYRRGSLLDIAGEKVSEPIILTALTEAIALLEDNCKIVEYTTRIEFSTYPPKYVVYVEVSKIFDILPNLQASQLKIEQVIFDFNELYKKYRDTGVIAPLELNLVQKGTFQELKKNVFCQSSESQFKMPRLLKSSEAINFLENKVLIKEK